MTRPHALAELRRSCPHVLSPAGQRLAVLAPPLQRLAVQVCGGPRARTREAAATYSAHLTQHRNVGVRRQRLEVVVDELHRQLDYRRLLLGRERRVPPHRIRAWRTRVKLGGGSRSKGHAGGARGRRTFGCWHVSDGRTVVGGNSREAACIGPLTAPTPKVEESDNEADGEDEELWQEERDVRAQGRGNLCAQELTELDVRRHDAATRQHG